jgi:hypothetical protein
MLFARKKCFFFANITAKMTFPLRLLARLLHYGQIKIAALPFTITAPGYYELTGNLYSSVDAITINPQVAGKVVLNLAGFTITSYPYPKTAISIPPTSLAISVLIENGIIADCEYGVLANYGCAPNQFLANIHVSNITFYHNGLADVSWGNMNSSSVDNCSFIGNCGLYGIQDAGSQTGNTYVNNYTNGIYQTFFVTSPFTAGVMNATFKVSKTSD